MEKEFITNAELKEGASASIEGFMEKNEQIYEYACSNVKEVQKDVVEFLAAHSFEGKCGYYLNKLIEKNADVEWFEFLFENMDDTLIREPVLDAFDTGIDGRTMRVYLKAAQDPMELKRFKIGRAHV